MQVHEFAYFFNVSVDACFKHGIFPISLDLQSNVSWPPIKIGLSDPGLLGANKLHSLLTPSPSQQPALNYKMNNNPGQYTTSAGQAPRMSTLSGVNRRRPMRLELTEEQKAEIREAFEIFDMDKDGALDFHEFKVIKYSDFCLLMHWFITGCTPSTWIRI